MLLKWLGEVGQRQRDPRRGDDLGPYDLGAASRYLERPVGRFYAAHFVPRLRTKALDVLARFPRETAHIDPDRVRRARTFREFDECLTAPLHGFAGADDYYRRASALPYLARIAVPTLCLSSEDDPVLPGRRGRTARATRRSITGRDIVRAVRQTHGPGAAHTPGFGHAAHGGACTARPASTGAEQKARESNVLVAPTPRTLRDTLTKSTRPCMHPVLRRYRGGGDEGAGTQQ